MKNIKEQLERGEAEEVVIEYRRVSTLLDEAATDVDREEYRKIICRMRDQWKTWQGEDSLHEMAFGEPWE